MSLRFNVSGPCRPGDHYMLPPLRRIPTVRGLVDNKAYFVLRAPRQVGKTTALLTMAQALTSEGKYVAAMLSMETGAPFGQEVGLAEGAILTNWHRTAGWQLPRDLQPPPWPAAPPGSGIAVALAAWAAAAPRPLVVFLDEIDALHDITLVAILRQLRDGANGRPQGFPWSLALCGVRDVRDYKIKAGGAPEVRAHGASPFNIKDESLTLLSFTEGEVAELLQQHTADTGQVFEPQALRRVFELTQGQPWLVNALARQLVEVLVPDQAQAVTADHVEAAREILIQRRDTHIDSLADKLHEFRVRRIIEPILVGGFVQNDVMNDDLMYVRDLGLIAPSAPVRIANPIYQEVIPRSLSYVAQEFLDQRAAWYQRPEGGLDMVLLLAAFQEFFAENSEAWMQRFDYQEAGPHLLLMAFLQRIVNGGGRIMREFAVGSGRADLVVHYAGRRHVIELKLRRGDQTEEQGVGQLSAYLQRLGESEGFLVIFDRRRGRSWADKLDLREIAGTGGERIYLFAM